MSGPWDGDLGTGRGNRSLGGRGSVDEGNEKLVKLVLSTGNQGAGKGAAPLVKNSWRHT